MKSLTFLLTAILLASLLPSSTDAAHLSNPSPASLPNSTPVPREKPLVVPNGVAGLPDGFCGAALTCLEPGAAKLCQRCQQPRVTASPHLSSASQIYQAALNALDLRSFEDITKEFTRIRDQAVAFQTRTSSGAPLDFPKCSESTDPVICSIHFLELLAHHPDLVNPGVFRISRKVIMDALHRTDSPYLSKAIMASQANRFSSELKLDLTWDPKVLHWMPGSEFLRSGSIFQIGRRTIAEYFCWRVYYTLEALSPNASNNDIEKIGLDLTRNAILQPNPELVSPRSSTHHDAPPSSAFNFSQDKSSCFSKPITMASLVAGLMNTKLHKHAAAIYTGYVRSTRGVGVKEVVWAVTSLPLPFEEFWPFWWAAVDNVLQEETKGKAKTSTRKVFTPESIAWLKKELARLDKQIIVNRLDQSLEKYPVKASGSSGTPLAHL